MLILLQLFQNFELERINRNSFYESNLTLIPEQQKDTTEKETYRKKFSDEKRYKDVKNMLQLSGI